MTDRAASREVSIEVPEALSGERVDRAVSLLTGLSRRVAADLLAAGRVVVDGLPARARSQTLVVGQSLHVELPAEVDRAPIADPGIDLAVVHEDDSLVVIDKPPGLVVHAGAGHLSGTLVSGLLARYPELAELPRGGAGDSDRPGIVHRLDKGTSGLLVVARTVDAYRSLSVQFREHSAGREYVALVAGAMEADVGRVDAPIGRSTRRPDRMAVTSAGRGATTEYHVCARFAEPFAATLVDAKLTTGRTHQVRVHLAAIGHPVVGDDRYGAGAGRPPAVRGLLPTGRLFLHAARLELDHPQDGRVRWSSPLPRDLEAVLDSLS